MGYFATKTMAEIIAERKAWERAVYTTENPYGYEISVNNPVLKEWFKRYVSKLDHKDGTEPQVRLEWERKVKALIRREYKKFYHENLREPVIGWTKTRVEELIIMLGADYGKES